MATTIEQRVEDKKITGYLPSDVPPPGAMISLGFQQVLTMFPATVLVAVLTKFDVGVTLLATGIGTIIALLVTKRRIPMYYGSSFSYITVVVTTMGLYAGDCLFGHRGYPIQSAFPVCAASDVWCKRARKCKPVANIAPTP